jgi:uncharacterized heparinase superfamily protein
MARVSGAERSSLSMLVVGRALRKAIGHLQASPLMRWRLMPAKTDRLVIAPQDLRTADSTRAGEIYAGRFAFAGKIVVCDGRSPFEMVPPSEEWAAALLGFGWLRHLRAADSNISRANARALVDEWIALQGGRDELAWRPDVLARRVMSWLSQAPLVLTESDAPFYRRFLRSLTRQVHYLRRAAPQARDGAPRLLALTALTYATLCMAGQMRHQRAAVRRLAAELDRQILPDGGHISRNPGTLIELLIDLLPLRQAFAARNIVPPPALLNAVDRMMPMLRFFRHGDGNFALFNGMGPTPSDLLATALAYDDARGTALAHATYSGYQRVETGDLLLLIDSGRPPPLGVSYEAHAGCLAFELSAKQQRIVVNCGMPATGRESWREVARATAAHSTVTFNDRSSCRFMASRMIRRLLLGTPIIAGPRRIETEREDRSDGVMLHASHDGYAAPFGVIHQRSLMVAADGARLEGEDLFNPSRGDKLPANRADDFAVRFHLHPSVKANRLSDGHGVMLTMPNREVWNFNAHDDSVELEESVYLAGPDGPRRTMQIVIYGQARKSPRVHWTFARTMMSAAPPPAPSRRRTGQDPELPL